MASVVRLPTTRDAGAAHWLENCTMHSGREVQPACTRSEVNTTMGRTAMETVCTHVAQGSGELAAPTACRECGETQAYLFGPFRFIPARRVLLFDDIPQRIGGRAIDILAVLLERAGEPVSKRELMDRVWPTTVVEDGNLKVNVAALRNALGGFASGSQYIATVNGR